MRFDQSDCTAMQLQNMTPKKPKRTDRAAVDELDVHFVAIAAVPSEKRLDEIRVRDDPPGDEQDLGHVVEVLERDDVLEPQECAGRQHQVKTIANPEKTAPATKYGGKIVVCQPGSTDTAKSND